MKKIVNVDEEKIERVSNNFLNYIDKKCNSFSVVVRDADTLNQNGKRFLTDLLPFLIKKEVVSEWPGTKLLSGNAFIYYFELNTKTMEILSKVKSSFDFLTPDLPEDPCFYRNDSPFLVTISHEKDLYFDLEEDESIEI